MHAIQPQPNAASRPGWVWGAPIEASAAILEAIGSEHPELIDFQAQALLNSTMSFAVRKLAEELAVEPEKVGDAVALACTQLDQLEKYRRAWRDPAQVLASPNVPALFWVCRARVHRVSPPTRRYKLERILRRLEAAYEIVRARAWIDDFIGPLPARRKGAYDADR